MSIFAALPSRMRSALLVAAVAGAPALARGQAGTATNARVETVVVTAPSIRVRSGPFMGSLSIDEFSQGTVFALASDEYSSKDWVGIVLDGRVAFVPRYAIGMRSQPVPSAPATAPATVVQAGAPTAPAAEPARSMTPASAPAVARPAPVASTLAPTIAPAVAPAVVAARPAPAPSVSAPAAAPAVAPAMVAQHVAAAEPVKAPERVAPAAPAKAPERVAVAEPVKAPERVTERPAAAEPAKVSAPAPEKRPAPPTEQPAIQARRLGLGITVGLLASFTPVEFTGVSTPAPHVAGVSFLNATYRGWGLYVAPEVGSGAGYRSTLFGGGLSRDLLALHMLRLTALAGYASYERTPTAAAGVPAPTAASLRGPSVGGMASVAFLGPIRLAYRGQYVSGTDAGVAAHFTRHSVGLVF